MDHKRLVTLLLRTEKQKQRKCPAAYEWLNKMWYNHRTVSGHKEELNVVFTQIETNLESTKAQLAKTNLESVMAQSVQCLLHKHKGPGSIPATVKKVRCGSSCL